MNTHIKNIIESFDFNSVRTKKSHDISKKILTNAEDPHNALLGQFLYRNNEKYVTRKTTEDEFPWGICVIEAKDTPDNKARFMALRNATGELITKEGKCNTHAFCCFGGNQDTFSDYYADYEHPENYWNGEEISNIVWDARKTMRGMSYDAVNFCKTYNVHNQEKQYLNVVTTGWYCPAIAELRTGLNGMFKLLNESSDYDYFGELSYIFKSLKIYGIWSCTMFRKEGTFGYNIKQMKIEGYKKKVGMSLDAPFVAIPFISF